MMKPHGPPLPPGPNDVGLRLVILYKAIKGATWLLLSAVLVVGLRLGLAEAITHHIEVVHTHLTRAWSIRLAERMAVLVTKKHILLASIALFLDGTLTAVEGWGLHTRKWWAEWLVVIASGLLLPFEVYEVAEKLSVGRVSVFVTNLAIVLYLGRRIAREHAENKRRSAEIAVSAQLEEQSGVHETT
jgi:uncharacterized membrane protein (DUF2068 family)